MEPNSDCGRAQLCPSLPGAAEARLRTRGTHHTKALPAVGSHGRPAALLVCDNIRVCLEAKENCRAGVDMLRAFTTPGASRLETRMGFSAPAASRPADAATTGWRQSRHQSRHRPTHFSSIYCRFYLISQSAKTPTGGRPCRSHPGGTSPLGLNTFLSVVDADARLRKAHSVSR